VRVRDGALDLLSIESKPTGTSEKKPAPTRRPATPKVGVTTHYQRGEVVSAWSRGRKPRERILESSARDLTDGELLAAVLGTGYAGASVAEVAESVLRERPLEILGRMSPQELRRIPGLGPARSCQLLAAIEMGRRTHWGRRSEDRPIRSPDDALPLVQSFAFAPKEHFVTILLDTRHRSLGLEIVSIGSLSASLVHPREVFRPAILQGAASVILAHNHPSGDPSPSEEDLDITQRLIRVGQLVGIEVLDHLILGRGRPFSMREAGLI